MPSKQETFNIVAKHLLTQGKKSVALRHGEDEYCMYRGDGGLKCAAGCLISDGDYTTELEGQVVNVFGLVGGLILRSGHNVDLVRRLQVVHDKMKVIRWRRELAKLAEEFDLTFDSH
jgi:hypothetical protein